MAREYVLQVPLRWVDLDAQGHVNNALVVEYLQEARTAFLWGTPNEHLLDRGCLVVSQKVEFRRPIEFDVEPVSVHLQMGKVGASRFTVGADVWQHGQVAARALTVLCVADRQTLAPRRMTAAERSWFAGWQMDVEPLSELGRWRVGDRAHEYDAQVRWSDLDVYGHVDNVRVFDLFAEARIRANPAGEGHTRMEDAAERGVLWMVARQDVAYLKPIVYGSLPYRVRTAYAKIGHTSMTLAAQIEQPGDRQVCARATTVLVCGDAAGRPIPVPPWAAEGLAAWPAVAG